MYDTINLYYDLKQEDEFKRLIPLINPSRKEFCYEDYGVRIIYHGHIGYLNVTLSPNRMYINSRSFCKWLKGDNLQKTTLKDQSVQFTRKGDDGKETTDFYQGTYY